MTSITACTVEAALAFRSAEDPQVSVRRPPHVRSNHFEHPTHCSGFRVAPHSSAGLARQVSPDGSRVVYVLNTPDLAGNTSTTELWLVELPPAGAGGTVPPAPAGTGRRLTAGPGDSHPRWAPGGSGRVAFSRAGQVWVLDLDQGGEPTQLAELPGGELPTATDRQSSVLTDSVLTDCVRCARRDRRSDVGAERAPVVTRRPLGGSGWPRGRRAELQAVRAQRR